MWVTTSMLRIFKFLVAGGIGVSINLGLYELLYLAGVPYLLGSAIAVALSTIFGFLLQKYWTFEERTHMRAPTQFIQYGILALANIAVNTLIVYVLVGKLGVHYLVAQAIGAATVAIYSFFLYRLVIFKHTEHAATEKLSSAPFISVFKNPAVWVLIAIITLLALIPIIDMKVFVGDAWRGIMPTFTDELNFARIHTIGEGHLTDGNPFFMEHADGPPLVLFGGAWLNAIPMWLGASYNTTLYTNFLIWSLLFAITLYWLLRELRVHRWIAVPTVVFAYLESYEHIWRPANLQPVYPFVFAFYTALLRTFRDQSRTNITLLALTTGISFYLFAYWWQTVAITLGLSFLFALWRKHWSLLKALALASFIGGLLGLPSILYTLWLSRTSPFFWESLVRLGLTYTHFSTSFELYYVGRWIVIISIFLAVLFWKKKSQFEGDTLLAFFIIITGVGLLFMDGNWIITGVWYDTEYHIRELIIPWLVFSTAAVAFIVCRRWSLFSRTMKGIAVLVVMILVIGNVRFATRYPVYFFYPSYVRAQSVALQAYAAPFAWLDARETTPVVVWANPHRGDELTSYLPIYTKHFVLVNHWGNLELLGDDEIIERYLVSEYFDNPSVDTLKSIDEMGLYLGINQHARAADAVNFKIRLCKIVFFWSTYHNCGTPVTPQSLLGDQFFQSLEKRFTTDIKPNIKNYLKKYHVKYILKDKFLDKEYHPEVLGAHLVWQNNQYEIWQLNTTK